MHVITTYRGAYKVNRSVRAIRDDRAAAESFLALLNRIEPEYVHRVGFA